MVIPQAEVIARAAAAEAAKAAALRKAQEAEKNFKQVSPAVVPNRRRPAANKAKGPAPVRPVGPIVNNPHTFGVAPNKASYQAWTFPCL